jgi:hypothetical protein
MASGPVSQDEIADRFKQNTNVNNVAMQTGELDYYSIKAYSSSSSFSNLSTQSQYERENKGSTGSMALSAVLSILMESHKDASTTSLIRAFTAKTLNFAIRINRVVFQSSHLLPKSQSQYMRPMKKRGGRGTYFLCLCLIFLGVV